VRKKRFQGLLSSLLCAGLVILIGLDFSLQSAHASESLGVWEQVNDGDGWDFVITNSNGKRELKTLDGSQVIATTGVRTGIDTDALLTTFTSNHSDECHDGCEIGVNSDGSYIYAHTGVASLYLSRDVGSTWTKVAESIGGYAVAEDMNKTIAVSPDGSSIAFTSYESWVGWHVYYSNDYGSTFTNISSSWEIENQAKLQTGEIILNWKAILFSSNFDLYLGNSRSGGMPTYVYKVSFPARATISSGSTPNSKVATIPAGVTTAVIPATATLPALRLNFGSTAPTAVTIAPVASNPATPATTPFKILGTTKIVDITPAELFRGSATVCLDGASTDHLFHYTGTPAAWVELPSRTYVDGQVCGVTTSFSPFAAAAPAPTAPVVVYVPPTPVPYLKTLTNPQIHLSGDKFVCTAGTYNSGYTLDGVIQGSATALYTPANYTFNLLFNQVAQTALAVTAPKNSASWSLSSAPAGALISCSVTVNANSLKNTDSSTANPASVSVALTTQSQTVSAAESAYNAAVSANSKSYQKALVDNRAAWRANVDKVRAAYLAELTRINALPASKGNSALKSAALKAYIADQKKTAVDYKASGPAALAVRDLANKAALDTKSAAIVKANSVYGAFIESIGYGVLVP